MKTCKKVFALHQTRSFADFEGGDDIAREQRKVEYSGIGIYNDFGYYSHFCSSPREEI